MDSSQAITHVSLCAGYGGIDLGLRRAIPNLRTIAFSEIEAFAIANLVAKIEARHLDPAPLWTDVKTFPWGQFHGRVDILSGGYPCQPFSAAGKRLGKDDPRHLWPWIADGILAMRPRLCFFENVEGHISLGLEQVLLDLQRIGYRCTFGIFSAAEVGAPHQRKRLFILAHFICAGLEGLLRDAGAEGREDARGSAAGCGSHRSTVWPSRPGESQHEWEPPRTVANGNRGGCEVIGESQSGGEQRAFGDVADGRGGAESAVADPKNDGHSGREGLRANRERSVSSECASECGEAGGPSEPCRCGTMGNAEGGTRFGQASRATGHAALADQGGDHLHAELHGQGFGESSERQAEPALGGDADGSAGGMGYAELCVSGDNRTDELRLLGNGVVPATAERAFRVLSGRLLT